MQKVCRPNCSYGSGRVSGPCPTLEQSTIDTLMTKTCSVNIDRKTVQGVSYRESALPITADYTQWCIQDFHKGGRKSPVGYRSEMPVGGLGSPPEAEASLYVSEVSAKFDITEVSSWHISHNVTSFLPRDAL